MEKEYTKICKFIYQGKQFQLLLDDDKKYFFLHINNDESYNYVTFEELIELQKIFCNYPHILNIRKNTKKKKMKLIPKIMLGGFSVVLSLSTLLSACGLFNNNNDTGAYNVPIENSVSVVAQANDTDANSYTMPVYNPTGAVVAETYIQSEFLNYIYIYDTDYLDLVLDYKSVSIDELKMLISSRSDISQKFKDLLYTFIEAINNKYPTADLRTLYENLKTLKIIECSERELAVKSLSFESYGCYRRDENAIYVRSDYDYIPGSWPYQVIFHEFSHILKFGKWDINDKTVKVQFESSSNFGGITSESLNSIFAVSLYNEDEKDIAYQLQSNYHKIFLECMNNYSLTDYVNKNVNYFIQCLDEYNHDENYAIYILELIDTQYKDYHDDRIQIEQKEFYPIYKYLCDMYFDKYITPNTSYSDAKAIADTLVGKITYDVPVDYNIDINYFYTYLDAYLETRGIQNEITR